MGHTPKVDLGSARCAPSLRNEPAGRRCAFTSSAGAAYSARRMLGLRMPASYSMCLDGTISELLMDYKYAWCFRHLHALRDKLLDQRAVAPVFRMRWEAIEQFAANDEIGFVYAAHAAAAESMIVYAGQLPVSEPSL